MSRPWASKNWSSCSANQLTVCAAKNSAPMLREVVSQATAFAPFSQNSNDEVWRGSGQAQPGQSKPSGWLVFSSARVLVPGAPCSRTMRPAAASASQPPAGAS